MPEIAAGTVTADARAAPPPQQARRASKPTTGSFASARWSLGAVAAGTSRFSPASPARSPTTKCGAPRRSAATCAPQTGYEAQRGDLGAPLHRAGRARALDGCGRRAHRARRGLHRGDRKRAPRARSRVRPPAARRRRPWRRRHAHSYAIANVAVCSSAEAASRRRLGRRADRGALPPVEASREPEDVLKDVDPVDDAVASAAYRREILPLLVRRALDEVEDAMRLTVNGIEQEISSPPLTSPPQRPARRARDHEPEGRLPAGWLRHVHRARRRRAAPLVPDRGRDRRRRVDHDARRARRGGELSPVQAAFHNLLCRAMRLLHAGDDRRCDGADRAQGRPGRPRRGARARSAAITAAAPAT